MNKRQQMFGNRLRELRIQKRLTQEQLGEYIGVTPNAIGQFERGNMYPNFETLYRIIAVLDIDANLFFSCKSTDYPYSAGLFTNLLEEMSDNDRVAVSRFLSGISQILVTTNEDEVIKDDEK